MASTGEYGGTAVAPATARMPKLGAACFSGWPGRLSGPAERDVRYPSRFEKLDGRRPPPLPPLPQRGRPVLEPSGAPRAREARGGGYARGLLWSPLCGGRRALRPGQPATWAGPADSGAPRGGGRARLGFGPDTPKPEVGGGRRRLEKPQAR